MELKGYQRQVLDDLKEYLQTLEGTKNLAQSFAQYWANKGVTGMEAYKNNIPDVPHVCAKVPTAGGKTYIAVNALEVIFSSLLRYNPKRPMFVVWLVPSLSILEQTVKNLSNPKHPYRKKLDQLFRHRVSIYEKRDVLLGEGFSQESITNQLSIVVMTFDSLRARNKEDRKIYQENGYLANFTHYSEENADWLLPDYDSSSLINVIRSLRPVVIVDESHNAESQLSIEMMQNLNPDFIFDLTATPKSNSNIVSYVDALSLKNHQMVKLPVIVANRPSRVEAIESSLILRNNLEKIAQNEYEKTRKYIRPIILFQAQPKIDQENTTYLKLKEKLISLNIPAEQIAIKTADINELKNVDLLDRNCPIRYIITVNALKEGWDCSFAYILVSLADKNSVVDVEQIVGRILRTPYAQMVSNDLLNMSYVFTASSRFTETLQNVVRGLNRAGFSEKDYRACDMNNKKKDGFGIEQLDLFSFSEYPAVLDTREEDSNLISSPPTESSTSDRSILESILESNIQGSESEFNVSDNLNDLNKLNDLNEIPNQGFHSSDEPNFSKDDFVSALTNEAVRQNQNYKQRAESSKDNGVPVELEDKMNRHRVKEMFRDEINTIELPQFFLKVQTGGFFEDDEHLQLLEKEELLKEFKLAQADANIRFDDIEPEMYRIDLETIGQGEYSPKPFRINLKGRERLNQYILSTSYKEQVRSVTARVVSLVGKMYPLTDKEITAYVTRIIETMNSDQIKDCLERDFAYVHKIKVKIKHLAALHSAQAFQDWLDIDKIVAQPSFKLPESIVPTANSLSIPKSLYITEAKMSAFEQRIIDHIANLDSVVWWHRNLSRPRGFRINGNLNHYPDFIVKTKLGHVIVLETKGDDRDNTDSELKLKLGKQWEGKAGSAYRYMMVFDTNPISGAERLSDAVSKIEKL